MKTPKPKINSLQWEEQRLLIQVNGKISAIDKSIGRPEKKTILKSHDIRSVVNTQSNRKLNMNRRRRDEEKKNETENNCVSNTKTTTKANPPLTMKTEPFVWSFSHYQIQRIDELFAVKLIDSFLRIEFLEHVSIQAKSEKKTKFNGLTESDGSFDFSVSVVTRCAHFAYYFRSFFAQYLPYMLL